MVEVQEYITDFKSSESTHIKINIPKDWIGAAKINCIKKSEYKKEQDTLISPYSVFIVKKVGKGIIELELDKNGRELYSSIPCMF